MNKIEIYQSNDVFTESEYVIWVWELIEKTRELDSTVIPHTKEELLDRYDKSLVCILDNKIIWHLSLCRTKITELLDLNIWEIWSVIIDKEYRWRWLWFDLIDKGIFFLWNKYDWIISATISVTMKHLLDAIWLTSIKFPELYFQEWKKHLSWLLKWWEEEFDNLAKCMFLENKKWEREKVIKLLK